LGTFLIKQKGEKKRYEIIFSCLTAAESFLIQLIHTFVLTQKCAKSQGFLVVFIFSTACSPVRSKKLDPLRGSQTFAAPVLSQVHKP
jgi:hypothetical protein